MPLNFISHYLIKAPSSFDVLVTPLTKFQFRFENRTYEYYDTKQGSDPHVFIHGNPTSKEMWNPILSQLSDSFRCISINLFPEDENLDYAPTLEDSTKLHVALLQHLGIDQYALVTHDWGVTIGLRLLQEFPTRIKRFAFMEGLLYPVTLKNNFFTPWFLAVLGKTPGIGKFILVNLNIFVRLLLPKGCVTRFGKTNQELYDGLYRSHKRRLIIYRWVQQIPMCPSHNLYSELEKLRENLFQSKIPKILFYARPGLALKNSALLEMRERCRNTQFVDLGKGTHFLPFDYPREIATHLTPQPTNQIATE